MKILSWNVNGIRASVKKDFVTKMRDIDADIICLQETKAQDDQVAEALQEMSDLHLYTCSAVRKGYSGVSILSKTKPLSVTTGIGTEEHDQEGRVVTARYENFTMISVYVPNSGSKLKRLDYRQTWDKAFAAYLSEERSKNPVIVTGDFNVAHAAIDLANPKSNYNKTSGYTQAEIDGMDLLLSQGFVDMYRSLYPEKVEYTFWSMRMKARERNVGWRIDYFLVDEKIKATVNNTEILGEVMGSDHCPISLDINI